MSQPRPSAEGFNELVPIDVAPRLTRLKERMAEAGLDALVVTNLANVRYLTGFTGSAGVLAVTSGGRHAVLTTDGRYRTQSAEQVSAAGAGDVVDVEIGNLAHQREAIRDAMCAAGAHQVGLEADHVSWAASERWTQLLGEEGAGTGASIEVLPTSGHVEALREVKDAAEVDRMARAAAIADAALGDVMDLLRSAGSRPVTELEVALELDTAMRRRGAEDRAFDTIVASGPHSAKPHHQPTQRRLAPGDAVVIDFGATFDGYRSDMTRTFCVGGPPSGELARIFEVVADSQAQGVAAVRAGVAAKEIDDVCRDVISRAGWADAFEHGTGHGVGLDIHEAPTVSQLGTAILGPGVVVTVEPGVYLPGIGGVRIEDTLVVTDSGSRALTTFGKEVAA